MYPSIPVSEFINPERGSSAFDAIARALEIKPEVVLIGTYESEQSERYYRVQSRGRSPHCVVVTDEEATCNCMAHHRPQSPLACLHIAQVLILEAENASSNDRG